MGAWQYIFSVLKPHRRRLIVALIAALGITLIDLGSPLVVAIIIDVIVAQSRWDLLTPVMLMFLALPLLSAGCRITSDYLMSVIGQRAIFDIRFALYRAVHRLSCRYLQNTTTGKLMERLRGDVLQLQTLLTNQTPMLLVQVATGLIMIGVMFFLSARLSVIVLMAVLLYVANYKWFTLRIRKVQRRYRRNMDVLSSMAQESLSGALVVKAFGNERRESRQFIKRNFIAERIFHRFRMLNILYHITSSSIAWGAHLIVLIGGSYLAVTGSLTFGAVTAMVAYTMRLLTPALQVAELSNQIQQAEVSLERIHELIHAEPDVTQTTGLAMPRRLRGEVAFQNVCFHYEPGKPVLKHFSLYVKPGQMVALVGHTGCGKTTITNLLYRFYDVQAGHLEVDGVDISQYDARWYRSQLAIVPQDPVIFDTTVGQNIAYGKPHATAEELTRAARLAELGNLLDQLPHGLETRIGGERGVQLSQGERQRICIARAMLADPAILILDEATSSLDAQSEAAIQLALKRVMTNRTTFVVAHRLSTIVEADQIVVMDDGRMVELGNHAHLMRIPDGRYRNLFLTQNAAARRAVTA